MARKEQDVHWDTCLVFAKGQEHRLEPTVTALHAKGIRTQSTTANIVQVSVPLAMLVIEAQHHKLIKPAALEARRQHPTLKGDKDRSSVCILRPTERILTTKWVLSTIAMPKPTPCASPGTAAVGEGQREVPDSVALTGTQKSQAAPVGGPSGRVLKRRGSQMSRARASISRIGHRLSDALRGAVPEEQRMQKAVDGFLHAWARNGWVKLVPLHSQHEVEAIWKRCLWGVRLPITKLQRYYGDQVAFYFAWMEHFTEWLLPVGLVGIIVTYATWSTGVESNVYVPLFSLFVVLWGVLFLRFWERKCASLAFAWGTLGWIGRKVINPEFQGVLQTSPITGRPSLYYPRWKRSIRFVVSCSITLVLVLAALWVMLLSLNLQGYIRSGPFFVPALAAFSRPGAMFDADCWYLAMGPILLHVVVVWIMNNVIYRKIAVALTTFENHHYESDAYDALIMKRIAFEACNAFAALFYVAFVECNVAYVRSILASLFVIRYMTSTLRRVATESVLPWILEAWTGHVSQTSNSDATSRVSEGEASSHDTTSKATVAQVKPTGQWLWSVCEQSLRDLYDPFDDYLEMVIEFGYVSLFASAFPLAAAISVAANVVEVRSDAWRLGYTCQRPIPRRAESIGMWHQVLSIMVWLSVVTNCLLFAMSEQRAASLTTDNLSTFGLLPSNVSERDLRATTVSWAWGIEHMVMLAALLLRAAVQNTPSHVRIGVARERYLSVHSRRVAAMNDRAMLEPMKPITPIAPPAPLDAAVPPSRDHMPTPTTPKPTQLRRRANQGVGSTSGINE